MTRALAVIIALLVIALPSAQTTNLDDLLRERAQLIAHAFGQHNSKSEWWAGYDWQTPIRTENWTDSNASYRGPDEAAAVSFSDIQASGLRDIHESEPVEINSRVIDAVSLEITNQDGQSEQPWGPYQGEFETVTSKEMSLELGFEQSISDTFTAGNDSTPVKNELTVSLGFSQTTTTTDGSSDRVSRTFAFDGVTPAGMNERITAWRKVVKMSTNVTGTGDYEHVVRVGKHWSGDWQGRVGYWESFADLLRTFRGEAPDDWSMAREFRDNPVPEWLIEALEKPLDLPFRQSLEFDQATSIQLRKESF